MQIKLSKHEVELKDKMSWFEQEEIKAKMLDGSKLDPKTQEIAINGTGMFEAKIALLELAVVKITELEGEKKEIKFSREWLKELDSVDGTALFEALDGYEAKKA